MVGSKTKTLTYNVHTLDMLPTLLPYVLMHVDLPVQYPDDKDKPRNPHEAQRLSCYLGLTMYVDLPMQAPDNTKCNLLLE